MQAYQTVSTYFIILNFDKVNVDRDHVLCLVIKEPLFVVEFKVKRFLGFSMNKRKIMVTEEIGLKNPA